MSVIDGPFDELNPLGDYEQRLCFRCGAPVERGVHWMGQRIEGPKDAAIDIALHVECLYVLFVKLERDADALGGKP